MVLVFDMVSSCWRQMMVPVSQQQDFGFIPEGGLKRLKFPTCLGLD
jgi:hypothetical protein